MPATFFLCSGVVGTNRQFWFETDMSESERQSLKSIPDDKRLDILRELGFSETTGLATRQALSVAEIKEMKDAVDFQSHTIYHPILPQCSAARALREISESRNELQDKFGLPIYALAYPNGSYSDREIEMAKAAGYKCALTMDFGFNSNKTQVFQLKRICINDDASIDELIVTASGLWGFLKNLMRSSSRRKELFRGDMGVPARRSSSKEGLL